MNIDIFRHNPYDMTDYVTVAWDAHRSRPVYCSRDGKTAYTGKSGMQIRVPYAPDKLSIVAFHDKANSVPVEPVQVKELN